MQQFFDTDRFAAGKAVLSPCQQNQLPAALGCRDWFCCRVSDCDALDRALLQAELAQQASYIEIVTGQYAASELATRLHQSLSSLYSA